ncbi:F-box protein At5g07610-like [Rutidosis leptorrhynchoides]|uniref:F-box protein At5g07610-like n=1 Tax=Rutidosis leptorrhynchoides TaxID=125765 RepID=UPI003A99BA60
MHAVESNDDLLIEILLRLPVISLVLFRSVSKRWLSIINNPHFVTLLRQIIPKSEPVSGLYIQNPGAFFVYDFVPLDNRVDQSRYPFKLISRYDRRFGVIILQSCHGLLLCVGLHHYYVYNPTTSLFKKIPFCPIDKGTIRMAYDPTKSPHYKLVYARHRDYNRGLVRNNIRIYTYSSETGIWSDCGDRYWSKSSSEILKHGIYWTNAIHWVEGSNHNKLCLEDLAITSVQAPGENGCNHKLFESRGCLHSVCVCPHFSPDRGELKQLNVYEMSNEHSEWLIKYIVHLDEAKRSFPKFRVHPHKLVSIDVWCIALGEREEDSFMVIDLDGTIMQYKIMSNTLHKLPYSKPFRCYHPDSFQFIASSADV